MSILTDFQHFNMNIISNFNPLLSLLSYMRFPPVYYFIPYRIAEQNLLLLWERMPSGIRNDIVSLVFSLLFYSFYSTQITLQSNRLSRRLTNCDTFTQHEFTHFHLSPHHYSPKMPTFPLFLTYSFPLLQTKFPKFPNHW